MKIQCPHCKSYNTRFMTQAMLCGPVEVMHNVTKHALRRKDTYLYGVNWDMADIVCMDCNRIILPGIRNYITKLEARVRELTRQLAEKNELASAPCARLHVTSTDTYPDVEVEVLDGTLLQPSMSPIPVYVVAPDYAALQEKLIEANTLMIEIGNKAHDASTGPAAPDQYWEIRNMAYRK